MKLISWNVNGLRACMKKGFGEFFMAQDADIFALQETKMQESQLDDSMKFKGYYRYMNSAERKGYSGTMVYTKKEPLSVSYEIEGDVTKEGRVITLEYEDFWFVCAYVPNSKDGLARLDYRMEWEEMLLAHLNRLNQSKPVIYCGDLNVAHNEIDIKNPSSNRRNAGFHCITLLCTIHLHLYLPVIHFQAGCSSQYIPGSVCQQGNRVFRR